MVAQKVVAASGTKVPVSRTAGRFIVVGLLNNAITYGLFIVLSVIGMTAIPAMTLTYIVGMVISFTANRRWTFQHQGNVGASVLRFIAVNLVGYGINALILAIFVDALGMAQIVVQFFAIGFVAFATFVLMKLWVFKSGPQGGRPS